MRKYISEHAYIAWTCIASLFLIGAVLLFPKKPIHPLSMPARDWPMITGHAAILPPKAYRTEGIAWESTNESDPPGYAYVWLDGMDSETPNAAGPRLMICTGETENGGLIYGTFEEMDGNVLRAIRDVYPALAETPIYCVYDHSGIFWTRITESLLLLLLSAGTHYMAYRCTQQVD